MVTLNRKESNIFIRKMLETERRPITKEELEMAKGVREIAKMEKEGFNGSSYVAKDGVITFLGEPSFTFKSLERIIKLAKKLKKGQIMCNMTISYPIKTMKGGKKYGKKR